MAGPQVLQGLSRGPEGLLVAPQVDMASLTEPLLAEVEGRGMELEDKRVNLS